METKEKEVTFNLPNEKVTVKFIPRKKGMAANVGKDHVISGGMLTNAVKGYQCPVMQRSGAIANILTKQEKAYLEKVLGIDLSVYKDFWTDFKVKLRKDDASNVFDLSDPLGFISVRILENYPDEIAKSWAERNDKSSYMFAITREGEEFKEKKSKLDIKKEAFKLYGKMEDDKDKILSVLKLITNQPISANSKLSWLQGKLEEHIDNDPTTFVKVVKDSSFETKALINKGVDAGVIKRTGNKYVTIDGLELCNPKEIPTFANAVRYLDDEKNQEVRLLIEARIDNTDE